MYMKYWTVACAFVWFTPAFGFALLAFGIAGICATPSWRRAVIEQVNKEKPIDVLVQTMIACSILAVTYNVRIMHIN
jgi:hypothetical protein